MLGRRVSIELGLSAIGAAPYDGCLRTLVEGIKPFVVRFGVKKENYELSSRNLTLCELLYLVFDTMPRDVRDQCAGFRARPRFTPGFRGISPEIGSAGPKFRISFIALLSLCRMYESHLYEMAKSV
ncbi:hypothetical protein YC2023_024212 [Brassica napus]